MKKAYTTAYSLQTNEITAVEELKKSIAGNPKLILFFASSNYNAEKLSAAFAKTFPGVTIAGCSTSGEIVSGKMLDNSVVAMAFDETSIADLNIAVIADLKQNPAVFKETISKFESHFGEPLSHEKHVGIVLTDGLSGGEEMVMDKLGDATQITFIGGSTGDDLKFKQTTIYHNDKVYHTGTLLLVMKPTGKFSILKTQSFKPTGKKLKVTKGVEKDRKILEFNNKPAAEAYAEALGVPVQDLAKNMFYSPLGLMNGDEPFVRSPRVVEGSSVSFFCSVQEGMDLMVLASTDIINDTEKALAAKEKDGAISGIINFNCILRTLDLKQQKRTEEYGKLFDKYPVVGFSTYGESYIGHINQTATMLVFHN
jgi:hypothetical protein